MALIGNMIATAFKGNSAMVNYDMFVATFGVLSLLYLLPTTFMDSFNMPIVTIALDLLNVLFWFCAAVATAAYLGVHSCGNKVCSHLVSCLISSSYMDSPLPPFGVSQLFPTSASSTCIRQLALSDPV